MAKKKEQSVSANERIIHIKAESEIYSVNALIPEKIVEKVLTEIRDNFSKYHFRLIKLYPSAYLKVQTCVHNPTMF
jgi:hypothetical protein